MFEFSYGRIGTQALHLRRFRPGASTETLPIKMGFEGDLRNDRSVLKLSDIT